MPSIVLSIEMAVEVLRFQGRHSRKERFEAAEVLERFAAGIRRNNRDFCKRRRDKLKAAQGEVPTH